MLRTCLHKYLRSHCIKIKLYLNEIKDGDITGKENLMGSGMTISRSGVKKTYICLHLLIRITQERNKWKRMVKCSLDTYGLSAHGSWRWWYLWYLNLWNIKYRLKTKMLRVFLCVTHKCDGRNGCVWYHKHGCVDIESFQWDLEARIRSMLKPWKM